MVERSRRWAATAIVLLAFGAVSCGAATIDVVANFPGFQGQNNLYANSYNASTNAWTQLTLAATNDYKGSTDGFPRVWKPSSSYDLLAPLYFGGENDWAVLSYHATSSVNCAFNLSFGCGELNTTVRAVIFKGDVADAGNNLWVHNVDYPANHPVAATGSTSLSAGQDLRIAIDSRGNMNSDTTMLSGTLNFTDAAVPEPGSLASLGAGIVGTFLFGLRRRK